MQSGIKDANEYSIIRIFEYQYYSNSSNSKFGIQSILFVLIDMLKGLNRTILVLAFAGLR